MARRAGSLPSQSFCGASRMRAPLAPPRMSEPRKVRALSQAVDTMSPMLRPLAADWSVLPWTQFLAWSGNSIRLGVISSVLAVALALLLAFSLRRMRDRLTQLAVNLAGLGYAVPGAVIVVAAHQSPALE